MAGADLGSLLQFIPSFLSLMKGMNNNGQKNTAAQLANVNNAITNPSNPLYQQMYGQYRQMGQQQLGENISQMEGQNRMLSGMGRTPLFAPERQGETAFRAQALSGPQIGIAAQEQTQGALMNALKGLTAAGAKGGVNEQTMLSQYGPRAQTGAANQTLLGLGSLGGMLHSQGGYQPPQALNAPGAQQNNSLLQMLFGGQ